MEQNQDYKSGNKRIVKNTFVVYGQLMLRLVLGLYTSRLALEALGVSDFGLYSAVGGVIALFTFISDSLSETTVRYINVERGKPNGNVNQVFNICHVLHIGMALFLLLLLEVGGIYYIHNFLNVEPGRETDAMFVFQVGVFVCCFGIINIPFSSLFNASEKFLFSAVVAISIKLAQLVLLIWLLSYEGNRVRAFVWIESLTCLASFAVYHYYCYRRWSEIIKWRFSRNWKMYKEILLFSYFNLLSSIAGLARGQGSLLLINYFFGTVVNGAFAVAKVIERNLYLFASNVLSAAAPQITQSYSGGDMERVFYLTSRVAKYCMLMMVLAFFPLWAELDFILQLWLIKVPEGALVFCQMILLLIFVSVTDGGLGLVVNASGKVSRFKTMYSLITLLCIPIGFVVLKYGCPAYMLLVVFLIADIIWRIVQISMMHSILNFPVLKYCREVYLPVIITCMPIILCLIITSQIHIEAPIWHVCHIVLVVIYSLFPAYYLGLKKEERRIILNNIILQVNHLFKN